MKPLHISILLVYIMVLSKNGSDTHQVKTQNFARMLAVLLYQAATCANTVTLSCPHKRMNFIGLHYNVFCVLQKHRLEPAIVLLARPTYEGLVANAYRINMASASEWRRCTVGVLLTNISKGARVVFKSQVQ